jgi:hypothetical protein
MIKSIELMRIRIQHFLLLRIRIQGFDNQKLKINYSWKFFINYQKLQLTYPWASLKDAQARGEAFNPQKRTSSTLKT